MKLIDLPRELQGGIRKPGETFILMGMMSIKIRYTETMDITSIVVNGEELVNPISIRIEEGKLKVDTAPIKDTAPTLNNEELPALNNNAAPEEANNTPQPLTIDSLQPEFRNGVSKASMDGRPAEVFSIIGTTMVRVAYDSATRAIISIEVNGELIENPATISYIDGKINVTKNIAEEKITPSF
ncbi:MAG TPA: hypothetical protein PK737_00110 [Bacilli bacterium]|nr:hypothetical protein [Bacilli bacterium]